MKIFKTFDLNLIQECQFLCGCECIKTMIGKRQSKFVYNFLHGNDIGLPDSARWSIG